MSTSSSIMTTIIIINNAVITVTICGSTGKESACNAGDLGSIPGSGRSAGEEKGYPLQHSGLENSKGMVKNQTRLSDFHFHFMYGCESWTIQKAECWRIGAFELWCWRRLLRVPGTARRSNQPRIFIGRTDAKAEALLWSPDAKNWLAEKDYFWERLRAGGEGGDREWNDWMASLTQFTWVWANSRRQWRTRKPGLLQSMGSQKAGHDLVTEQHFFQVWQSQFSLK